MISNEKKFFNFNEYKTRKVRFKNYIMGTVDVLIILFSFLIGTFLKNNFKISYADVFTYKRGIVYIVIIYIAIFLIFNIYSTLWLYAGLTDYLNLATANFISTLIILLIEVFIPKGFLISTVIVSSTFVFLLTEGFRILYRAIRSQSFNIKDNTWNYKRALIIGAGRAGKMLLNELKVNKSFKYNLVGFVDDDINKVGQIIDGIPVVGRANDIPKLVIDYDIEEIILAIPSLDSLQKKRIFDLVNTTKVKMKTLPNIGDIMFKGLNVNSIRDVEITDLLGRKEISIDIKLLESFYMGKKVLVTGGGGSIGSELCRQVASLNPSQLIIIDNYENNAYDIQNELKRKYPELDLRVIIASVRDRETIFEIFEDYSPDIVVHAAAHKHVPLMENSPAEAIKNNVFGTLNVVQAADNAKVKRMLLISTDKAVNPTNTMGATKRLCEIIVQTYSQISKNTDYIAVRFGNVLGSNGSVIPLFKRQISEGGPVTVTHKEITRYFMTIPEAVQLVLTACTMAKGGEIFVLDMGEPVKIYELARNLIRLSGFEPEVDIKIEITGLRPGEKLYEELLMAEEGLQKTENSLIYIGKPYMFNWNEILPKLEHLREIVEDPKVENEKVKEELSKVVCTYKYEKRKE